MVIALIALAAFVVLLSVQVCFAQTEIKEIKKEYKALKSVCFDEIADFRVRIRKLESEVEENEQH